MAKVAKDAQPLPKDGKSGYGSPKPRKRTRRTNTMSSDLFEQNDNASKAYSADDIEVLEGLEPVRKRPGMYIGGTDERALHHLVTEVLDNSMDEAVAGHANRIDVALNADGSVMVRDNGRGIPVDPHPRFPDKSALEVILTTLHAGGKFSGKAYQTSGGLHGVGVSVVNALSDHLDVEVAREKRVYGQKFSRGLPVSTLEERGAAPNRRGTTLTFHPDPEIFGDRAAFKPSRLVRMVRSKAYLFRGVEIRWRCDPSLLGSGDETPAEAVFHFPNGLADFLAAELEGEPTLSDDPFAGRVEFSEKFPETPGAIEWAIHWSQAVDGAVSSYCNTIPTPQGGTHEIGMRQALTRAVRAHGEMTGTKKAAQITADDVMINARALVSIFIREPEFQGQTKEKLSTADATRLVEGALRDRFDNWLAADPKRAETLMDFCIARAEDRARRRSEKETQRKSATKRLRLPGKLTDCSDATREGSEIFLVEGDSAGGSAKQARDRRFQAVLPLRGKILNVANATADKLAQNQELQDLLLALGVQAGSRFKAEDLRYDRIIIMTDADVDGAHIAALLMTFFYRELNDVIASGKLYLAAPPLYRITSGAQSVYAADEQERDKLIETVFKGKKVDIGRFKGLGEMMAKQLKDTTMDPTKRKLIRVRLEDVEPGETHSLVERLMGKKAEKRFEYIQSNARFAEDVDV